MVLVAGADTLMTMPFPLPLPCTTSTSCRVLKHNRGRKRKVMADETPYVLGDPSTRTVLRETHTYSPSSCTNLIPVPLPPSSPRPTTTLPNPPGVESGQ